jgi:hypothetical protein
MVWLTLDFYVTIVVVIHENLSHLLHCVVYFLNRALGRGIAIDYLASQILSIGTDHLLYGWRFRRFSGGQK